MIGLHEAALGGLAVESLLYGTYLVMFSACIYVLLFRRHRRADRSKAPVNKTMLVTSLLIFCMLTAHWIINVTRAFDAFVRLKGGEKGPLGYYANLSEVKNVIKTGLFIATISTADTIMTWRLYAVWGRNRIVIIPAVLMVVGLLTAGTAITYEFSQLKPPRTAFSGAAVGWINTCFSTTLVTNLYATSMISFRIWRHNKAMRVLGHSNLTPVIVIIVESAAIYSLGMFITFVCFLAKSNVQFPELDATNPLVGIVFSMIIVRIGLGIGLGDQATGNVGPYRPSSSGVRSGASNQYPLTSLHVDITQVVEADSDSRHDMKTDPSPELDGNIRVTWGSGRGDHHV